MPEVGWGIKLLNHWVRRGGESLDWEGAGGRDKGIIIC